MRSDQNKLLIRSSSDCSNDTGSSAHYQSKKSTLTVSDHRYLSMRLVPALTQRISVRLGAANVICLTRPDNLLVVLGSGLAWVAPMRRTDSAANASLPNVGVTPEFDGHSHAVHVRRDYRGWCATKAISQNWSTIVKSISCGRIAMCFEFVFRGHSSVHALMDRCQAVIHGRRRYSSLIHCQHCPTPVVLLPAVSQNRHVVSLAFVGSYQPQCYSTRARQRCFVCRSGLCKPPKHEVRQDGSKRGTRG